MKNPITALMLVGVLNLLPVNGLGAATDSQTAAAHKTKASPTHATSGVVKSVDDNTLVISRGKSGEMTFAMNSSTHREGMIAAGNEVSVRYTSEGKMHTAMAVTARHGKTTHPAASKK